MQANAQIYQDIFNSISSKPIPYLFILDRDERKHDLLSKKYGQEQVKLLGKREFENYLLDSEAIAYWLLNSVFEKEVEIDEIQNHIDSCLLEKENKDYFPKGLLTGTPLNDVRGSKVLDSIVKTYVNQDYSYSKPKDGGILVKWILGNKVTLFEDIHLLVEDFLFDN